MASSSSRKSNSSASKQKPTFRRSSGAASVRTSKPASAKPAAAPAASQKASARTYTAPTKHAAVNRVTTARAARPKVKPAVKPAVSPTKRQASVKRAATAAKTARAAAPARRAAAPAPAKRAAAPAPRRQASAAPAAKPKRSLSLPVSIPKKKASQAPAQKQPAIKPSAGIVRAVAPTAKKLSLPFGAKGKDGAKAKAKTNPIRSTAGDAKPKRSFTAASENATRIMRIAAAAFISIAIVFGLGAAVIVNSGFFSVSDVVINGSAHVPQQTVEQLIDVPEGSTLFNLDDDQITEALMQNPWVESVKIEREFPHTITITPVECQVSAIAYIVSDDVAWAISADDRWIAPVSIAETADATGTVVPSDDSTDAADGEDAGGTADDEESVDGEEQLDEESGDSEETDGEGEDGEGAENVDAEQGLTEQELQNRTVRIEAAVEVAQQAGAVLLTDVGTDVTPSSGRDVSSEVILAGLKYAQGFSSEFRAMIKDISVPSIEAISANLFSGVEVSLGAPEDIQQKEQVILQLLEQEPGVTYINVRVADAYSFRSADV